MGYHLNRLDASVLIAVSKPLLTEFGIHQRLESCEAILRITVDKVTPIPVLAMVDFGFAQRTLQYDVIVVGTQKLVWSHGMGQTQ